MSPDRRRLLCAPALLSIALAATVSAQVLVHPGWMRTNSSAAEPWYQRAVFYQMGSPSLRGVPCQSEDFAGFCDGVTKIDFKAFTDLDALQSTGIDAVIVPPPALPSLAGASADQALAAQSELDSFDSFTRQATAHGIRVLVALPAKHADSDLSGRIRFWLTRGVAGLRLEIPPGTSTQDRAAIAASARTLAAGPGGQRIVLVDAESNSAATPAATKPGRADRSTQRGTSSALQLQVIPLSGPLTAASLRPQLATTLATRDSLLDTLPPNESADAAPLARALTTLALAANPAALIDPAKPLILPASIPPPEPVDESVKPAPPPTPPQPPPGVYLPYVPYVPPPRPVKKIAPPPAATDPFTEWVAKLAVLHHSNAALRTGSRTILDFDAQNVLVWVAKPALPTPQNPPVVVLCNLSAQPVEFSLADAIKKLNLHGFFLRTLLRSDDAMGAQDLNAIKLAPYAVFIGEVRR